MWIARRESSVGGTVKHSASRAIRLKPDGNSRASSPTTGAGCEPVDNIQSKQPGGAGAENGVRQQMHAEHWVLPQIATLGLRE